MTKTIDFVQKSRSQKITVLSSRYDVLNHAILQLIGGPQMKDKPEKSFRTLASELKASRKQKLTPEQIDRLNKVFDEIEKEQLKESPKRKIAKQPEV